MKHLSNEELELRFEAGEDMGDFMDGATARVIKPLKTAKINVDFTAHLRKELDQQVVRYIGVPKRKRKLTLA